jgi:hypothetical protein
MSWARRLYNAFKRRADQARYKEFAADVTSPFALGSRTGGQSFTVYTMKGPARVAIRSSANQSAGRMTVNGLALPALTANVWQEFIWFEEGEPITIAVIAGATAATVSLGVLRSGDVPARVATGTIT